MSGINPHEIPKDTVMIVREREEASPEDRYEVCEVSHYGGVFPVASGINLQAAFENAAKAAREGMIGRDGHEAGGGDK